MHAMAGGTARHDLAAFWLARRLADALEPEGCAVFPHNRKLRIDDVFRYPDVLVRCGRPADEQFETDARVIVEVSHPDSGIRDRQDKAANYARLPSLQAYLVVDPDLPRIEVFAREAGVWEWRAYGPGMTVDLGVIAVEVDQLYAYVDTLS